jgi:hypothetical protein
MFWEKIVLRQCFVYNARPKLMTGKTSYSFSFPENIFILIKLAFVLCIKIHGPWPCQLHD